MYFGELVRSAHQISAGVAEKYRKDIWKDHLDLQWMHLVQLLISL